MSKFLIIIYLVLTSLSAFAQGDRIDTMYFEIKDINPPERRRTRAGLSAYESGYYDRQVYRKTDHRREHVKLWVVVNGQKRLLFNCEYKKAYLLGYFEYMPLVARAAFNNSDSLLYVFIQWDNDYDIYKLKLDGSTVYRYPFRGYGDTPEEIAIRRKWFDDTHIDLCGELWQYLKARQRRCVDADMEIEDNVLTIRCYLSGYDRPVIDISYDFATQKWAYPDEVKDPFYNCEKP